MSGVRRATREKGGDERGTEGEDPLTRVKSDDGDTTETGRRVEADEDYGGGSRRGSRLPLFRTERETLNPSIKKKKKMTNLTIPSKNGHYV